MLGILRELRVGQSAKNIKGIESLYLEEGTASVFPVESLVSALENGGALWEALTSVITPGGCGP